MIQIDNITYFYKQNEPIFSDFSLSIEDNQTWSILGPSGCGKTTLLYLISGLFQPQNGEIRIYGKVINRPDPSVGLIIQEYGLLPWATVRINAQLGVQIREFYGPDGKHAPRDTVDHKSVDGWLERLGLLELADQYPSQISGGQRQRTAIARTL
ncbi:MAG: ATP-binding cassette domain-containing protein, partial [Aliifodinibius sp.]|nr:ATP-binding cassette domain-containing protein [candidate division Zixibacteria bacterium]NIT59583.1 ATP-binding cassette domain-containing protein [Fodinibius sp.]NIW47076.1 ATP-binding cassette domain-containing protein [Gammaproteobacteria bacterium]NIR65961.1 ATP-binding cassette domain-containing protein [candidate division Zixibacteria bacterium]NIS47606.1 ATP-binding cassette domain-containing protein [candidate division Zixibacteria bacterium]